MKINIKKLRETAKIPTRGSDSAAGYDLYADIVDENVPYKIMTATIHSHETLKVGTGIALEIPEGYFGAIFARSGLATRQGLRLANCLGVLDSDFRGEVIVALHNDSSTPQAFSNHDRIAQLVILPYLPIEFNEVDELNQTGRGEGGFGHTGKD